MQGPARLRQALSTAAAKSLSSHPSRVDGITDLPGPTRIAMSRATRTASEIRGGYFGNAAAYVLGVPLAMGLLYAIDSGMIGNAEVQRYTQFAVQKTAVVLFCCAMCGLGGKLVRF